MMSRVRVDHGYFASFWNRPTTWRNMSVELKAPAVHGGGPGGHRAVGEVVGRPAYQAHAAYEDQKDQRGIGVALFVLGSAAGGRLARRAEGADGADAVAGAGAWWAAGAHLILAALVGAHGLVRQHHEARQGHRHHRAVRG